MTATFSPSVDEVEVEFRSSEVVGVSFPKRTIELVVMPYEQEAVIEYRGRPVTEICSRGAYDGVQLRTSRIKVNREHNFSSLCGKAVALHPSNEDGLVAELRMAPTPLGEESLVLADEGILDASAGFGLLRSENGVGPVVPNAEVWETRSRRRLNHLHLDHIALTASPAYDGAHVLAVRNLAADPAPSPTPNRDRLWLEEQQARMREIDLRYGV